MDPFAETDATLDAADRAYTQAQAAANAAKEALFDACADSVRAGRTPDSIAERLKASKTPEQLEAGLTFTAAYIRRRVRERGVAPLHGGPKPRKQPGATEEA